jgi:SAM-dependent methyltransferase
MHGVEIAEHALQRTRERLQASELSADLRLISVGQRLPYVDSYFDAVYSWQVLCYNDRDGFAAAVGELERVTSPGGLIVIATVAPGDVSQVEAEPLGNDLYRSRVRGQEGCVLLIPDRPGLGALFPGRQIEVGEFGFRFPGSAARYWVISYRLPRT